MSRTSNYKLHSTKNAAIKQTIKKNDSLYAPLQIERLLNASKKSKTDSNKYRVQNTKVPQRTQV